VPKKKKSKGGNVGGLKSIEGDSKGQNWRGKEESWGLGNVSKEGSHLLPKHPAGKNAGKKQKTRVEEGGGRPPKRGYNRSQTTQSFKIPGKRRGGKES